MYICMYTVLVIQKTRFVIFFLQQSLYLTDISSIAMFCVGVSKAEI